MCVNPLRIYDKVLLRSIPVPCSKCPECIKTRINSWKFRLTQERRRSQNVSFITLTYNDDNLKFAKNGKPTLVKRDLQLFFKKLRKQQLKYCDWKLKYYAVGEYGTKYKRPHYHIILFNLHPKTNLAESWNNGFIDISPAREHSIGYTLKYISKPKTKSKNDVQLCEFSLMSKNIGSNYLTENIKKYHSQLYNCFLITEKGYKMPIPKYYKEKLYNESQRAEVTAIIKDRALKKQEKVLAYLSKKSKNPETLLEIRKSHSKFDTRIQETL